jgi:hypothetical protein
MVKLLIIDDGLQIRKDRQEHSFFRVINNSLQENSIFLNIEVIEKDQINDSLLNEKTSIVVEYENGKINSYAEAFSLAKIILQYKLFLSGLQNLSGFVKRKSFISDIFLTQFSIIITCYNLIIEIDEKMSICSDNNSIIKNDPQIESYSLEITAVKEDIKKSLRLKKQQLELKSYSYGLLGFVVGLFFGALGVFIAIK